MDQLIYFTVIFPILSLLISYGFANHQEKPIFWSTIVSIGLNLLIYIFLLIKYFTNGLTPFFLEGFSIYHSSETDFSIKFFIDGYAFVYLITATVLTTLIAFFSKFYIHREAGYKRFFNNLIFFYLGLVVILSAGNMETLFIGWEIIGVTSFFLIGFYRERYLPVKNALKVVSLYRVADIALLISIWVCHHYFEHSVTFDKLPGIEDVKSHIRYPWLYQYFIPAMFLLAAMVKSAQFPFSFWLPRAMEGPTTSSAIFYGSLSVHIGVFLLIRTAPLWQDMLGFKLTILIIGLLTSLLATFTARVQSSIKTQIAYSSAAQIGLMFMEVALGWYWLAMVHFVSHAFLRSYQLLVSPSVLSYRIHDQFFNFVQPYPQGYRSFWDKIKLTVYLLSIKEFNLDRWMYLYLWQPFKKAGKALVFINLNNTLLLFVPLFVAGFYGVYHKSMLPDFMIEVFPTGFMVVGFALLLRAFVERATSFFSWILVVLNQLYTTVGIGFNETFDYGQLHLHLSGVVVCGIIGYLVINRLKNSGEDTSLNRFHGHVYEYPRLAFVFVLACLGLAGFPITPTFIGEDLLLGHVHEDQFILMTIFILNLIMLGIVVFRIYARLFLGIHDKGYHVTSYRSS